MYLELVYRVTVAYVVLYASRCDGTDNSDDSP